MHPHEYVMHVQASALRGRYRDAARDRIRREDGQAVTEYGIVLGVLIVLLATTVLALNTGIGALVTAAAGKVAGILP
jgi:hypothetical protein